MSCAAMKSAELCSICSGVFPDLSGRTDPGFSKFGIGALLEYCFTRSVQRSVADVVSSRGLLPSVFFVVPFPFWWILVFLYSFSEHLLLIVDVTLCTGQ
ncbi:hypothetical protein A2U01_0011259 [Trifolium medium]|uniref:Uncharacterized protein n=1 Tax=Trifolium medium TaxID=97028 RepID=A0A392MTI8_9FABA|nr:hypothetical protein [Trifolium medium]